MKGEKPIYIPRTSYTPFLVLKWYFQPDRDILERHSMHYHIPDATHFRYGTNFNLRNTSFVSILSQ